MISKCYTLYSKDLVPQHLPFHVFTPFFINSKQISLGKEAFNKFRKMCLKRFDFTTVLDLIVKGMIN